MARIRRARHLASLWKAVRPLLSWQRLAAGVVAGVAALGLTFLLRLLGMGVFVPELAVDWVVVRIPGALESAFIGALGKGAKVLALSVALLLVLLAYGLPALAFRAVQRRIVHRWRVMLLYAAGMALTLLLVVLPFLGYGLGGSGTNVGLGPAVFSQVLGAAIYAGVLDALLVDLAARHPRGFSLSRRRFLTLAVGATAAAGLAVYGLSQQLSHAARLSFASVPELLRSEVTPTGEFYVISKNVVDPAIDSSRWHLRVDGRVDRPATYDYRTLSEREVVELPVTLECISNEVGGDLISTGLFGGIPLFGFLEEHGLEPQARWVGLHCTDGYTIGVPLSVVQGSGALLVLRLNGAPLPGAHGFPARVIVPGWYGMFSAKWLERISVRNEPLRGFWQQKGWADEGTVHTTAIIATPAPESVVELPATIGGVAFAGTRGIADVQISTDGGGGWEPAELTHTLDGPTWVLWTYTWQQAAPGRHRVMVRATDGAGHLQGSARASPFPDGATGIDHVDLLVA